MKIVRLFPDLLGTYGDDGNAVVLQRRATWRGYPAEVVDVTTGSPIPDDGAIYTIGGGEDGPQVTAARQLAASGALHRAVDQGAVVLAVCAGLQMLGTTFLGPDGNGTEGLGLLDISTGRVPSGRLVGELVVDADPALGLPALSGYENHAGATHVGTGAKPLGRVRAGHGNGDGSGTEGAWAGRILGTYMHGPVLARNAALADLLLTWALGVDAIEPLSDPTVDEACEALRAQRVAAALKSA